MLGGVLEYDPSRRKISSGGWKWAVFAVLIAACAISFVSARIIMARNSKPIIVVDPADKGGAANANPFAALVTNAMPHEATATNALPKPVAVSGEEMGGWLASLSTRPAREQTLLKRLVDAEKLGQLTIAVDTIVKLRASPAMADLEDKLARHLGELNMARLFSGEPVPWVVETTVRRGQSVHRIAREHGTTVAAVRQLNGLGPRDEPESGRVLRVLEFPRAALVVHKQTRCADLMLGGKLFKRYYVSTKKSAVPGSYPITSKTEEGPRSRFASIGIRAAPSDMLELDMFLAPGSSLTVSEM